MPQFRGKEMLNCVLKPDASPNTGGALQSWVFRPVPPPGNSDNGCHVILCPSGEQRLVKHVNFLVQMTQSNQITLAGKGSEFREVNCLSHYINSKFRGVKFHLHQNSKLTVPFKGSRLRKIQGTQYFIYILLALPVFRRDRGFQ